MKNKVPSLATIALSIPLILNSTVLQAQESIQEDILNIFHIPVTIETPQGLCNKYTPSNGFFLVGPENTPDNKESCGVEVASLCSPVMVPDKETAEKLAYNNVSLYQCRSHLLSLSNETQEIIKDSSCTVAILFGGIPLIFNHDSEIDCRGILKSPSNIAPSMVSSK